MKLSFLNYLIKKINESGSCKVTFNRINDEDSINVCKLKIEWDNGYTLIQEFESIKHCEIYLDGFLEALPF